MDILDLLRRDHCRLREELERMRREISAAEFRRDFEAFASHFKFHENVEDNLLLEVADVRMREEPTARFLRSFDQIRSGVWPLLEAVSECCSVPNPASLFLALANFRSFMESHFNHEEQTVFPALRKLIERDVLKEMAREKAPDFRRFRRRDTVHMN